MRIWMMQVTIGALVGAAAYTFVPGHVTAPLVDVVSSLLLGAVAGALLARRILPGYVHRSGGAILASLGALTVLLVYAITSHS